MKTLLTITAAAMLLITLVPVASAQGQYNVSSNYVWSDGSTTTNPAIIIGVTRFQDVSIQVKTKLGGAGTTQTAFSFYRSANGVDYETNPCLVMQVANAGSVSTGAISNLNVGASGYLKLGLLDASADSDISSNYVWVSKKPNRFGR